MTVSNSKTPTSLDEAIRMFKGYTRFENGFDELDFKEWLIEWREQEIAEAKHHEDNNVRMTYYNYSCPNGIHVVAILNNVETCIYCYVHDNPPKALRTNQEQPRKEESDEPTE